MKADEVTSKWIDSVPNHPHFCESRKVSEVKGISLRRSMQAEMASGSNQTVSSAIVRIESKILISLADQSAEYVRSFNDLVEDENRLLTHTLRGSVPGSDIMEKDAALWRFVIEKSRSENVQKKRRKIHCALVADGEIYIKYAHFDCEPAAYQPFQQKFDKPVKMCSFHVKSAVNRKIQREGMMPISENTEFKNIVRMRGACRCLLQLSGTTLYRMISEKINQLGDEIQIRTKA
uniref:Transposase n=1 Tax=Ditylenchus dipsaci TaxID=166011 RepID=A0A915ERF7_9BILA